MMWWHPRSAAAFFVRCQAHCKMIAHLWDLQRNPERVITFVQEYVKRVSLFVSFDFLWFSFDICFIALAVKETGGLLSVQKINGWDDDVQRSQWSHACMAAGLVKQNVAGSWGHSYH